MEQPAAGAIATLGEVRSTWVALAWGAWARALFFAVSALAWPFAVCAPRAAWARYVAHLGARVWFRGTRTPLRVHGLDRLRGTRRPWVAVANHASKLDAVALAAALPLSFAFVAKAELRETAWLRWPLQKLGMLFVQPRGAGQRGRSQVGRAVKRLRAGDSLFWFPEGGIEDRPGLAPFHRGAFVAALQASAPVVPIALRGTRSMLPDPRRLPRPGRIEIEIGMPIETRGAPEDAVDRLCQEARSFVATRCGEPDLGHEPRIAPAPLA